MWTAISVVVFSVLAAGGITAQQVQTARFLPVERNDQPAARIEPVPDPLFGAGVAEPPSPGLVVDAIVVEVYDGDTITVQPLLPKARIRLLDCWAPEIRTRNAAEKVKGFESRDHLRGLIPNGARVRLHIPATDRLQDSLTLGRVLGRVWRDVDGDGRLDDVSVRQVDAGHATKTKGGR